MIGDFSGIVFAWDKILTCQFFDVSIFRRVNFSTCQFFDVSIFRRVNFSTCQNFGAATSCISNLQNLHSICSFEIADLAAHLQFRCGLRPLRTRATRVRPQVQNLVKPKIPHASRKESQELVKRDDCKQKIMRQQVRILVKLKIPYALDFFTCF